jgi:hypothetical protein
MVTTPSPGRPPLLISVALPALLAVALAGCGRHHDPRAALERYFSSAERRDYAATYDTYDTAYRAKVSRDEYVRHRAEASPLQSWRVLSVEQHDDRASAEVALVFGPLPKAGRTTPVSTTVHEDLVREDGEWRIRVW